MAAPSCSRRYASILRLPGSRKVSVPRPNARYRLRTAIKTLTMLELPDSWTWDFWLADTGAEYHLFFLRASRALLDPDRRHYRASVGHAVSTDLVNWDLLPDALVPSDSPAWDDLATWTGRRDQSLLVLACQTGLRATELTSLAIGDVHLGAGAHVSCLGKGRKQRITPLTPATVTVLRSWLAERGGLPAGPLFITRRGTPLSRDALERRIAKYTAIAAKTCPSLPEKKVSPHTLRHSAAMRLLGAGVDTSVIALWMGHENTATTQVYIHADLALKERAIARTAPQNTTPGRYQPADDVLAFLDGL